MIGMTEADKMLFSAKTAEETKKALNMGANVNARNSLGKSALITAETDEKTEILIKAGADVNAKDCFGVTALIAAKTSRQTKLLYEAGADVNAIDICGKKAIDYAKSVEQLEILMYPVKHKENKLTKSKTRVKGLSGVVVADMIADMKVSGIIYGDVTPNNARIITKIIMRNYNCTQSK